MKTNFAEKISFFYTHEGWGWFSKEFYKGETKTKKLILGCVVAFDLEPCDGRNAADESEKGKMGVPCGEEFDEERSQRTVWKTLSWVRGGHASSQFWKDAFALLDLIWGLLAIGSITFTGVSWWGLQVTAPGLWWNEKFHQQELGMWESRGHIGILALSSWEEGWRKLTSIQLIRVTNSGPEKSENDVDCFPLTQSANVACTEVNTFLSFSQLRERDLEEGSSQPDMVNGNHFFRTYSCYLNKCKMAWVVYLFHFRGHWNIRGGLSWVWW